MGTIRKLTGADAGDKAANQSAATANQISELTSPYREFGKSAGIKGLEDLFAGNIDLFAQPGISKSFDAGAEALQRRLAASGFNQSGNELLALADYNGNFSRNLYNDFFNQRFGLAQMGSNAATGTGSNITGLMSSANNVLGSVGQGAGAAGFGGLMNMGGFLGGAALGNMFGFSDERLKDNIKHIGTLESGIKVYEFTFKGDTTPQVGVMAQEVEEILPEAVVTDADGYKRVNYGILR